MINTILGYDLTILVDLRLYTVQIPALLRVRVGQTLSYRLNRVAVAVVVHHVAEDPQHFTRNLSFTLVLISWGLGPRLDEPLNALQVLSWVSDTQLIRGNTHLHGKVIKAGSRADTFTVEQLLQCGWHATVLSQ